MPSGIGYGYLEKAVTTLWTILTNMARTELSQGLDNAAYTLATFDNVYCEYHHRDSKPLTG